MRRFIGSQQFCAWLEFLLLCHITTGVRPPEAGVGALVTLSTLLIIASNSSSFDLVISASDIMDRLRAEGHRRQRIFGENDPKSSSWHLDTMRFTLGASSGLTQGRRFKGVTLGELGEPWVSHATESIYPNVGVSRSI